MYGNRQNNRDNTGEELHGANISQLTDCGMAVSIWAMNSPKETCLPGEPREILNGPLSREGIELIAGFLKRNPHAMLRVKRPKISTIWSGEDGILKLGQGDTVQFRYGQDWLALHFRQGQFELDTASFSTICDEAPQQGPAVPLPNPLSDERDRLAVFLTTDHTGIPVPERKPGREK